MELMRKLRSPRAWRKAGKVAGYRATITPPSDITHVASTSNVMERNAARRLDFQTPNSSMPQATIEKEIPIKQEGSNAEKNDDEEEEEDPAKESYLE